MVANIWVASADNNVELVKKLIESGTFDPNSKDPNGYTPIHAAASYGHLELLEYLISKGGDINIQDTEGDTPLHHVEEVKVAKFLIENLKANRKVKNNDGQTALQYIEEEDEFPELVKYLQGLEEGFIPQLEHNDTLPKDGEIIEGHQVRYSYETQPNEIVLMHGLTEEQREAKLKEIAESENPEELLRELVTKAVHQHVTGGNDDSEEGLPSHKKSKN